MDAVKKAYVRDENIGNNDQSTANAGRDDGRDAAEANVRRFLLAQSRVHAGYVIGRRNAQRPNDFGEAEIFQCVRRGIEREDLLKQLKDENSNNDLFISRSKKHAQLFLEKINNIDRF